MDFYNKIFLNKNYFQKNRHIKFMVIFQNIEIKYVVI